MRWKLRAVTIEWRRSREAFPPLAQFSSLTRWRDFDPTVYFLNEMRVIYSVEESSYIMWQQPNLKCHELKVIFKFKLREREMERTCLGCPHLRSVKFKWNVTLRNVWWTRGIKDLQLGDQVSCLLTEFQSMWCKWNFQWSCWHMLLPSGRSRSTGDYLLSQRSPASSWGTCHCYQLLASAFCFA